MSQVRIVKSGSTVILQATRPTVGIGTPMLAVHNDLTGRSTSDAHPTSAITGLDAALAARQPLDADLTAIAALTTTAYGRGFLPLSDAPAAASYVGISLLATSGISGTLTLTKTGTTARTVTFPDQAITVAGKERDTGWTALQTFTAGLTVSAGTTAVQALTCTTLTASGLGLFSLPGSTTAVRLTASSGNHAALSFFESGIAEVSWGKRAGGAMVFNNGGNLAGTDIFTIGLTGTATHTGGTMTVPSATQVIAAAGKLSCGDTSATSIQTAGGITAAGAVTLNGNSLYVYRTDLVRRGRVYCDNTAFHIESNTAGNDPLYLESPGATGLVDLRIAGVSVATVQSTGITLAGKLTKTCVAATGTEASLVSGSTTSAAWHAIQNTGGSMLLGVDRSTGGYNATGATAYSTVLSSSSATALHLATTSIVRLTVAAGGDVSVANTTASTSTTTGALTVAGGIGVAKEIVQAAVAATTVAGATVLETNQDKHYVFTNGIGGWVDKCIFSQYASVTQSGVVTAQSLISATARGTRTLPANFFKQGKVVRYRFSGVYTTDVTSGNATVAIKIGSTTFRTTPSFTPDASITNGYWEMEGAITCYTTGVSGTLSGVVVWKHAQTSGASLPLHIEEMTTSGTVTFDTTASGAIDLLWTATDAGTAITCSTARLWEVC